MICFIFVKGSQLKPSLSTCSSVFRQGPYDSRSMLLDLIAFKALKSVKPRDVHANAYHQDIVSPAIYDAGTVDNRWNRATKGGQVSSWNRRTYYWKMLQGLWSVTKDAVVVWNLFVNDLPLYVFWLCVRNSLERRLRFNCYHNSIWKHPMHLFALPFEPPNFSCKMCIPNIKPVHHLQIRWFNSHVLFIPPNYLREWQPDYLKPALSSRQWQSNYPPDIGIVMNHCS